MSISGKKSYLAAAIIFLSGGLLALGVISREMAEAIALLAGGFGIYGIRDAVKKLE